MSNNFRSAGPRPVQVLPAEMPSLKTLLTLAVFVVVVAGLYLAREVLIPVTLAVLLSFVLAPLANLLRALGLGKVLSALLAVILALCFVLAIGGLIATQLANVAEQAPRYQSTIQHKIEATRSLTLGKISAIAGRLGRRLRSPSDDENAHPSNRGASEPPPGAEQKPLAVEVHQPDPSPVELAQRMLTPVVSPLSTLAIVFVIAIFVLLQREDLRDRLIRLFGSRDLHRTTIAMDEAANRLSRYFLAQLGINASFGAIIAIGLSLIGIPSPILWGIIGALLRFVPYIGAFLSAVLPLALAAAVDPGWTMLLWTAGLYIAVELVTGQAVEPYVYGQSTGLSPISVVVAAIFWTWLWGPIGLILSTPLTLCLVVLGRHVDRLEFLEVALGDSPPLTPIENFYQRMIASDPDETLDQAEQLLKECSLSSYYDEIVRKGLQLAANDVERGVLAPGQLERIDEAVRSLIDDLASHDDANPEPEKSAKAPATSPSPEQEALKTVGLEMPIAQRAHLPSDWQGEAPVLCVAGRGPFDEAASTMLGQLLSKHGLGAQVVPHDAVSRANIRSLDTKSVRMMCLTYLEIAGTPSHLRFLLRRLRRQLPDVPILVGLWSAEDPVFEDERLRATIGVDYYASSLREAVNLCLRTAGVPEARSSTPLDIEADPPAATVIVAA
jgi:predicted PurR-regulated permease PerM